MSRRGGRVHNWIGDIPFETYLLGQRLSWVSFIAVFPLAISVLTSAQFLPLWLVAVYGVVVLMLWRTLLVVPLNRNDPHGYCKETTVARGLLRALAHRKSRPELPADRVRTD